MTSDDTRSKRLAASSGRRGRRFESGTPTEARGRIRLMDVLRWTKTADQILSEASHRKNSDTRS